MKIEFSKDWCMRMAQRELDSDAAAEIARSPEEGIHTARAVVVIGDDASNANIAFGRFVRLMRRSRRQTLEGLADQAEIEITELVEIEADNHHKAEPRTVYQLAKHFRVPMPRMMQLAGLTAPKDARLYEEAVRFAARSETVEELNEIERAALEAFVSVLSEQSDRKTDG